MHGSLRSTYAGRHEVKRHSYEGVAYRLTGLDVCFGIATVDEWEKHRSMRDKRREPMLQQPDADSMASLEVPCGSMSSTVKDALEAPLSALGSPRSAASFGSELVLYRLPRGTQLDSTGVPDETLESVQGEAELVRNAPKLKQALTQTEQDRLGLQRLPADPLVLDAADLGVHPAVAVRRIRRDRSKASTGAEADDEGANEESEAAGSEYDPTATEVFDEDDMSLLSLPEAEVPEESPDDSGWKHVMKNRRKYGFLCFQGFLHHQDTRHWAPYCIRRVKAGQPTYV